MQDSNLRMHESKSCALPTWLIPKNSNGVPEGTRTPGTWLRRPLLYPAELQAHNGAGEGDRTLATGLEGRGSTTELHPHGIFIKNNTIISSFLMLSRVFLVEESGFEPLKA